MAGKKKITAKTDLQLPGEAERTAHQAQKKALTQPVQPEKIQQALQAVKDLQRPDRLHPVKSLKKIRQEAACEMRS